MSGVRKALAYFGLGVFLICIVGVAYQQWAQRRDARVYPMPGKLVDVGDHRLHIRCVGEGSPTVLMIAGAGSPSVNSYDLQDRIAKSSHVCSYDRAGLGWSDPATHPMGLTQIADDLEAVLARSGEKGPYILVPESFGGTIALAVATRRPDQVAGIVAVDPTEPRLWRSATKSMLMSGKTRNSIWQVGWRIGLIRLLVDSQAPSWAAKISPKHRGEWTAIWSRPMASFTYDWIDAYEQTPSSDLPVARPGLLGAKPLIVISHGRESEFLGEAFQKGWPGSQIVWTQLSTHGTHIIASNNTHMIAQENPALVADSVEQMIAELRQGNVAIMPKAASKVLN